jgi:hypothetical protein
MVLLTVTIGSSESWRKVPSPLHLHIQLTLLRKLEKLKMKKKTRQGTAN